MTTNKLGRRFGRIMLILPHVLSHPGVTVDELAQRFGATHEDIQGDLQLLFVCGLPGYGPGDLIDVQLEGDQVFVEMADYFSKPLRLTTAEAIALYSGGVALVELPGMEQADSLRSALQKLRGAIGAGSDGGDPVEVVVDAGPERHIERIRDALVAGKQVRIQYLSASRGELSERDVEPWGLVTALGRLYLVGLDHASEEERLFRTDRIKDAAVLDEPAAIPDDFDPQRYKGAFLGRGDEKIALEVSPAAARWFRDYYPSTSSAELKDGWLALELVSGGVRWAAELVARLGADVRNVHPPEVMTAARELARRIAARYA